MVPLQFGIPGGPELLVILLILFLTAVPVLLVVLFLASRSGGSDRVEELEARVEELEDELREERR
jgi:sec-independent protein translocase protein TatA